MSNYHGYLTFQSRGLITIPKELREKLHASEPGIQLEITERDDGVFELRPVLPVPADQRWFWAEKWQRMELEAESDIAEGRVAMFDDVEAFLDDLDS